MNRAPLISVIMPLYNGEAFLPASIASILRQNRTDLEFIVIDDGSTDRGLEVVRRLAPEARCFRQENRGCPAARNTGLSQVCGQWVAFLDADDEWPDGSLAVRAAALAAHPDAMFVQGRTNFIMPAGSAAKVEPWVATNLGAGLFRRELFDRAGRFDESRGLTEDVEWFMRVRELGPRYITLPDVTLHYRLGTGGITHGRSWRDPELKQALRLSLARRRQAGGGQAQELNWLSGSKQDSRAAGEVNHGN